MSELSYSRSSGLKLFRTKFGFAEIVLASFVSCCHPTRANAWSEAFKAEDSKATDNSAPELPVRSCESSSPALWVVHATLIGWVVQMLRIMKTSSAVLISILL